MIISPWACQGSAAPENRAHTHSYPNCMTNYLSINGTSLFKHRWILPLLTSLPPTAQKHNPAQRPNNPCFSPHIQQKTKFHGYVIFSKSLLQLIWSFTCSQIHVIMLMTLWDWKVNLKKACKQQSTEHTAQEGQWDLQPLYGCESFQPMGFPRHQLHPSSRELGRKSS